MTTLAIKDLTTERNCKKTKSTLYSSNRSEKKAEGYKKIYSS